MTNRDVARAFASGKACRVEHFTSTGRECYSYRMKLAQFLPDGSVEVIKHEHSPSRTTSRHLSLLRAALYSHEVAEVNHFTDVSPFSYGYGETG